MISLPFPPNHVWLKSFWLVMSAAGGILIGAVLFRLLVPLWLASAVAGTGAVVLAVPGLLWPQIASRPYRAWNKLGCIFARNARRWLLLICYYLVFVAVGRIGASLRLSRPVIAKSQWIPRHSYTPSTYGYGTRGVIVEESPYRRWISSFLAWATSTHNEWVCCLLPFLLLYAALESEQEESSFPIGIYTLF
jgi:hypothetical protein